MKKTTKSKSIYTTLVAIGALTIATACGGNGDGNFPDDTIEIVVPFSAGGATDAQARAVAEGLEHELGTTVLVVNRPGGAAATGATEVLNSSPDGYTLFLATATALVNTPLLQDVSYSHEDFRGIAAIADQPYMMVVSNDADWEAVDDMAGEDRVTYAVTGIGNYTHIVAASFLEELGVNGEAVPFDDAAAAINAVNGGQVDFAAIDLNIAAPQVEGGQVKGLAVTATERVGAFPDIPTFEEEGYTSPSGILSRATIAAPAEVDDSVAEVLTEGISAVVESDDFREFMESNYLVDAEYNGIEYMEQFVPAEIDETRSLYEDLGLL